MTVTAYQNWRMRLDADAILWLTLDCCDATVNTLNTQVFLELSQLLAEIEKNHQAVGLVIESGKKTGFIAGADVRQFTELTSERQALDAIFSVHQVLDKLEALGRRIPTVALIAGFCLGGGLELALCCNYRIASHSDQTLLGLPEVKLGLHPGWGGTVRLPRTIGVLKAMQLMLSGKRIRSHIALKLGLVDATVPVRHLVRAARHFVLEKPKKSKPPIYERCLAWKWVRPYLGKWLTKKLADQVSRRHYPAPYAVIENWVEKGIACPDAMRCEAESVAGLLLGRTSRNLVQVFYLQQHLKNLAGQTLFTGKHVHVIGAGTMGGDIAAWCALKGFTVTLQDAKAEALCSATSRAHRLFQKKIREPHLRIAAIDRLIQDASGEGIRKADIVIEAVCEDLSIKQALYQAVEPVLKPGAILASNTSGLSLDSLSSVLKNRSILVGLHFFNPVDKMQLVEVVHTPHTDLQKRDQLLAFVCGIDRLPLPVKDCPGFLINRILMPYLLEAMYLLDEHHLPEVIDQAAVDFGMPIGPVRLADMIGLDICFSVASTLIQGDHPPLCVLTKKVKKGHLGKKTGRGFYHYKKGKGRPFLPYDSPDAISPLTDRLIFPMLNEAVRCWHQKVVSDRALIDAGLIFGTGFAPFRGGPLHYIETVGVDVMLEKLTSLYESHGDRFKPDVGWQLLRAGEQS